eukprot:CAMPEP_0197607590 /NCGR_PEP_ID=MMETSP1326-20131121/47413_1 /TAXON_ID=1155430 /ORGANISM="Genus nov. species nov., Strain RCC2288" /LENGTH=35 /DNA_ID= /DNA_START= /DNA_END= /DNA_ORIENTATION=
MSTAAAAVHLPHGLEGLQAQLEIAEDWEVRVKGMR